MLIFWIILGVVLHLSTGYLAGYFSWKAYYSEKTPRWIRFILWPMADRKTGQGTTGPPIEECFKSLEAYATTMAFALMVKVVYNCLVLITILIIFALGVSSYCLAMIAIYPGRKLAEINSSKK